MARKSTNFEDRKIWNTKGALQPGDQIEGYFVAKREITTKFGAAEIYDVDLKSGEKISIMGSAAIKNRMNRVPVSSYVWVTYKGKVDTDNGAMNDYEIDYDDEM